MKIGLVIWIVVISVVFSSLGFVLLQGQNSTEVLVEEEGSGGIRYNDLSPITIDGNLEFKQAAQDNGWPGEGSQATPFLIDNYEVNATGNSYGIYIKNTNVYFEITNCYLHGASTYQIYLYNVSNGTVFNTTTDGGSGGIILNIVSDTVIENNTVSNAYTGISGYNSNRVSFYGNKVLNPQSDGIYITNGGENKVENNSVYGSSSTPYRGIYIWGSSGTTNTADNVIANNTLRDIKNGGITISSTVRTRIENNVMYGTGIFLEHGNLEYLNTHTISGNTVNGKKVYYLKDADLGNTSAPLDAGQIILVNTTNYYIEKLDLSNTSASVEVLYSSNITVKGNNCSLDYEAIYFYESPYGKIENNMVWNGVYGIFLDDNSHHSLVANNTISGGERDGLLLDDTSYVEVFNNEIVGNGYTGIYLYYSDYDYIHGNRIMNSGDSGVYMEYANHVVFERNNVSGNADHGFEFYDESDYNLIVNNHIANNTGYGVYLDYGYYNHIYNNSFYFNNGSNDTYDSSHIQAYDGEFGYNFWNDTSRGNFWYDWQSPDSNGDGIVDNGYSIGGGATDNYPLTTPTAVPELSIILVVPVLLLVLLLRRLL